MEFDEYQLGTRETAIYPEENALLHTALGVAGEAGEVAESVKKYNRGDGDERFLEDIEEELGDLLWFIARLADENGSSLGVIAEANLEKLDARASSGTLHTHNLTDADSSDDSATEDGTIDTLTGAVDESETEYK